MHETHESTHERASEGASAGAVVVRYLELKVSSKSSTSPQRNRIEVLALQTDSLATLPAAETTTGTRAT